MRRTAINWVFIGANVIKCEWKIVKLNLFNLYRNRMQFIGFVVWMCEINNSNTKIDGYFNIHWMSVDEKMLLIQIAAASTGIFVKAINLCRIMLFSGHYTNNWLVHCAICPQAFTIGWLKNQMKLKETNEW